MLGHAKLETTAIYTHVAVNAIKEAHRRCHPARIPGPIQHALSLS
jgi:site-specific recombinase XerD